MKQYCEGSNKQTIAYSRWCASWGRRLAAGRGAELWSCRLWRSWSCCSLPRREWRRRTWPCRRSRRDSRRSSSTPRACSRCPGERWCPSSTRSPWSRSVTRSSRLTRIAPNRHRRHRSRPRRPWHDSDPCHLVSNCVVLSFSRALSLSFWSISRCMFVFILIYTCSCLLSYFCPSVYLSMFVNQNAQYIFFWITVRQQQQQQQKRWSMYYNDNGGSSGEKTEITMNAN